MSFLRNTNKYHPGIFAGLKLGEDTKSLEKPRAWLQKQADAGCPQAQANLGVIYALGIGVPQDLNMAITLFKQAAEKGNGLAFYNLGVACEDFNVPSLPSNLAVDYYRKSAASGFHPAVLRMAVFGTRSCDAQTLKASYKMFKQLTKHPQMSHLDVYLLALAWLAACVLFGVGITKNRKKGIEKMENAARMGGKEAQWFMYQYYGNRSPGFPVDGTGIISSFDRLYPPFYNPFLHEVWHYVATDLKVTHSHSQYGNGEIQQAQGIVENAQKFMSGHYAMWLEELSWAQDSGIIELHEKKISSNHGDNTPVTSAFA